ncbi:hypothetical protein QE422_002770 [Chryseobacterium sp. SORGH_AS 447]|uniref:nuclear transport factor 2 family protein n=1 Tax=Chryseobacterium sp. SORGH_AS_0447 TaxID=3041769 RepID=UPI002786F059|nr:nuclear transport factor 2 family protein [Chryseobacterium sp. SORGH_AS_0447]MDQ1162402.1 hypothetical protein [Chryseobacterium sp. SORGH_AS_0447]
MKTISLLITILLSHLATAQYFTKEKAEIENVIQQFKESIVKKDSAAFYGLFHEGPVVMIGIIKNRSPQKRLEADPGNTKNYFSDTYKNFFRYVMEKGRKEEKFRNITITNDDVTGSVTFKYVFLEENILQNWGTEYWQLIKAEGKWKIVSITYSYENAKFFPKPFRY